MIKILGAGIAGNLAAKALNYLAPVIFEMKYKSESGLSNHWAVMRIRNPDISKYLGCAIKKIRVKKAVLSKGKLLSESNIQLNNLYSRKLYGVIGERSLNDLSESDRYLIGNIEGYKNTFYNKKVEKIEPETIFFEDGTSTKYDICMSTLPLPALLSYCNIPYSICFESYPIWVRHASTNVKSNVNQTIYIPEPDYLTYRITLQEQIIIQEAVNFSEVMPKMDINLDVMLRKEFMNLIPFFGLGPSDFLDSNFKIYCQPAGKIIPVDDSIRKGLIGKLTKEFNIYSFGRYAIWKPIRVDHLLSDIEVIKRLIEMKPEERKYEIKKELIK